MCARACCSELPPGWELDIHHSVIEECNKHGGAVHVYVDKNSVEVSTFWQMLGGLWWCVLICSPLGFRETSM